MGFLVGLPPVDFFALGAVNFWSQRLTHLARSFQSHKNGAIRPGSTAD